METTTIIAFVAVGLSAVGIGLTIVILLLRGSFLLGGSINQVNNLGKQVEDLTAEVKEQRQEHQESIQRSNREHQESIQRSNREHQESIQQSNREHQEAIQQSNREHREAIQRSNREHQEAIQRLRQEHQESIQQLRAEMVAGFDKLADAINSLRDEVQQNNQMLAALANHTHDTDGRTVFTLPSIA